ncbi:MAG TPA: hypothetical protein PLQ93_09930 [Bacteroidia bacterium]|nr:hypothetical protein [Bacteroidia bacterium]
MPAIQVSLLSQNKDSSWAVLRRTESELQSLQKTAFFSRDEKERLESNKAFIALWDQIVNDPEIMNYRFDSLREISILSPEDGFFKLITWNIFRNDGTYQYFGYLLVKRENRIKTGFWRHKRELNYNSYKLIDRSATVKSPENYISGPEKWFGMLYYELIDCGDFFTLLGYDPNDKLVRRKFVDVLYFKSNGSPVFGKDVFRFPRKNPKRLMFEYSSDVVMSLKFNKKLGQIVYSHLASNREGSLLEGQVQYYGPDGSFDALELRRGRWNLVEDIDARNEKSPNDNARKPDPKKQTPIFKPK